MSTSYHWHLKIYFGLGYIWHFKSNFFWYKRGAIFPTWTIMIEFYKLIILVLSRISHTQKDKSTFHSKYNWQLHILYDWNLYLILFKNLSIHWSPPKWQITCLNVCSASIQLLVSLWKWNCFCMSGDVSSPQSSRNVIKGRHTTFKMLHNTSRIFNRSTVDIQALILHSSEKRGLRSTFLSCKMLQNLPYL